MVREIGAPRGLKSRGRALPRGVAARPSPACPLFLVNRLRQDTAGLGPCGLRSHGADHAATMQLAHCVQATMPGLTTRQGRGPPRGAAPLKGAEGKGGSARQTHDKSAVPFQGMDEELF